MANKVSVDLDMNVQGYVQGIDQASQSTEKYETDLRKIKDSTGNFRKEFAAAKKEVLNLAQAYNKLDSEAKKSAFGQEMARQLNDAKEKAAEMTDMMGDINQELKNMASDTRILDTMSEGMNVFMNATSAASGVIAQFTGDEKAAQQAVVMFTTAQSTLNTLTAISNALQKQSNTMLAVRKVQELATTAAIKLRTAAETKGVVATKAATAAQKAFNIVASANPYVLLATAILAVGAACYAFASSMSKAKEREEEAKKAAEAAKEAFEKERTTMANASESFLQTASKIQFLKDQYEKTTDALEKTEILKEATGEFKKMGLSINNVNDAQKALVQNGDALIELLRLQGEAAALAAIRMELFKEKFTELMKSKHNSVEDAYRLTNYMLEDELNALDKQQLNISKKISGLKKQVGIKDNTYGSSKSSNKQTIKIDYDKGSLEDYKKQLSALQDKLRKKKLSLVDVEKDKKRIKELTDIIENKEIELGFKEQDPKKIQGTEAWWKEEINKLEKMKALLPIDAYIDRDKLQKQIDNMNLKVKLETEGVTITGSETIADAWAGKTKKTISSVSDAISALQKKLQDTDWSTMGKVDEDSGRVSKSYDDYIAKIQELQSVLIELQKTYNDSLLLPMDKALKMFDETMEKAEKTADAFASFGSIANSIGSAFKSMGDETTAAVMQTVGAMLDMTAQVIPQIMKLIGAKQAEAMAAGTAEAAKLPYPANIGAIASIVATVLSTFASIWAALESHADGGIVGGSSYSGDRVLARLNSGEMVLNKRQQTNLFNMLDNNSMPTNGGTNVTVTGVIRGTDIMLVQKNTNKVLSKAGSKISF